MEELIRSGLIHGSEYDRRKPCPMIDRLRRENRLLERLLAEATLYFDDKDDDAADFRRRLHDMGLTWKQWREKENAEIKKESQL